MLPRIVITGIGLTAPNGNSLEEFRTSLVKGKSGVKEWNPDFFGKTCAGVCDFNEEKYQTKKQRSRGTRAGSIGIYCAEEALIDASLQVQNMVSSRIGIYIGITEHGSTDTFREIYNILSYDHQFEFWSHYHSTRVLSNNPSGEISIHLKTSGPHYTIGGACAAGAISLIHGMHMLQLGEIDCALAGGVSEAIHSYGYFASFKAQNALAQHPDPQKASRPFDAKRNGIVISEGGCIMILERLDDAVKRKAKIYGELAGYSIISDAHDSVMPYLPRQIKCIENALIKASLSPDKIDLINTHATGTIAGDPVEAKAISTVFEKCSNKPFINNTKGMIGHCMGASAPLEVAGNLLSFTDHLIHPSINIDSLDQECYNSNIIVNSPCSTELKPIKNFMKNSFGMFGINTTLIIKKYPYE